MPKNYNALNLASEELIVIFNRKAVLMIVIVFV